ncbi:nucleotide exchange factor GrpE [Natrinema halophilum]|uniref:Protein GrpE n=1 Tax=Natrinema halophilum TaxID=1699371 RepID=A0A7D5GJF9_9EURY|nr:nucleotide exchange factor GrpE [Natrinema halophilum]QLG48370.1 nucleotide exchange factor GrpE [Natrinema halophilum]
MSEDEGTNASAQGVQSEEESNDGEMADVNPEESVGGETESAPDSNDSESEPSATESESEATDIGSNRGTTEDETEAETDTDDDAPETSEDIQRVLDRVTEYDDELAHKVSSIVEEARDLNGTVTHQREELEDLEERIESQAETIGELQDELDEYEQALNERDEQLEAHKEEIDELKSRLKRKQADFQNYKKRAKKRQQQIKDRATEDLVERLIGVRDNLKRALEEESDDTESLQQGVEMTLREFDRILEDENVSEIDPEPGTEADPQRHEVMMQVESSRPEGTIDEVYTPGYEMGDKVIQNAQVTISNGDPGTETESPADDAERGSEGASDDSEAGSDEDADESAETNASTDGSVDVSDDAGEKEETDADDGAIELGGEVATDDDIDETPVDDVDE